MSKRDWRWQDAIDAQEYKDYEEMIRSTDILNQDERQQENTEEERFLNQRDFIECKSAQSQFWNSDTWN